MNLVNFVPWIFMTMQAAIVIASLLGYGIFTSRPDLLAQVDPQAKFFVWAFHGFAVGNMLFGGLAVCAEAMLRDKQRALWAFLAVYAISLASELIGTTYGVPFGAYSYTSLLGIKWFDRVPVLIPLSWFTMSWACWILARRAANGIRAVLLATSLLVAWDLLLDPAMSRVTSDELLDLGRGRVLLWHALDEFGRLGSDGTGAFVGNAAACPRAAQRGGFRGLGLRR
jgi:uncharacterized membrane protein